MGKDSYYNLENRKTWIKALLILLFVVMVIAVFYILFNSFGSGKVENNILRAGIDYYDSGNVLLPEAAGECSVVTLRNLLTNEYVKNPNLFTSCDGDETYIKVCKLANGKYHYTPVIKCGTKDDTKFGDWKEGAEGDLIENKSDVRFTYLAQVYSNAGKAYYPNDKSSSLEVSELYISSPSSTYLYKDKGLTASKWYTEQDGTSYWNNGDYSSTQPNGYSIKGSEGSSITSLSISEPINASYRTITQVTLYRTKKISTPYILNYMCIDKNYGENSHVISNVPCESRSENNYNITAWIYYTCDGKNSVSKDSTCSSSPTSDWTTTVCTKSNSVECETTTGYQYVDRRWQWYSTGSYKKYYPSGASTSTGEITYYVSAPVSGAKQDSTTTTTAYKYYKLVEGNSDTKGEWINLDDNYLDEEGLIKIFNNNNFDVKSLEDIAKEEKIKYSTKLEYSNRE